MGFACCKQACNFRVQWLKLNGVTFSPFSGHRILEESAEEDEQVAVPGPLLQGPELGRQDERASGAYRLNN